MNRSSYKFHLRWTISSCTATSNQQDQDHWRTFCRGDRGSLGHGVQWDIAYIGNSKKENAIMILSNKCKRNPPSFCFLSRRNVYSCKSGEKKLLF